MLADILAGIAATMLVVFIMASVVRGAICSWRDARR